MNSYVLKETKVFVAEEVFSRKTNKQERSLETNRKRSIFHKLLMVSKRTYYGKFSELRFKNSDLIEYGATNNKLNQHIALGLNQTRPQRWEAIECFRHYFIPAPPKRTFITSIK